MDTKDTKEHTHQPGSGAVYLWTDAAIQSESMHMPPDLREDYVWLKVYCRDECARDVDVLTERLIALGHSYDKTTISRIVRGRYQRSATNQPLPSPIIKADRFTELVCSLRDGVRAEALQGRVPFVVTTTTKSIFEYIDAKRAEDRVNKFGVTVGATGSGKSASFIEYVRQNNHGMCHHVEAPEGGSVGELITMIAMRFGYSPQINASAKRVAIFNALGAGDRRIRSKRCLIIDNCQDLYRYGQSDQPAFSFLRRVQDVTGCTVILSVTPTFERNLVESMVRGYFEQFEGRSGGRKRWLRLPEYPPVEDAVAIAKAFGVESPAKHGRELAAIAREQGRIRFLFEILQEAKTIASAEDQPLTIELIREIREGGA